MKKDTCPLWEREREREGGREREGREASNVLVHNSTDCLLRSQNITFEGFDVAAVLVDVDAFEEKVEGGEEEDEPTDNSPWANSDRDYTYEEVGII